MAKVLILTHEFEPFHGGVATYCHELASAAQSLGHTVTVVAPSYGKTLCSSDLGRYSFKVIRFRGGKFRSSARFLSLVSRIYLSFNPSRFDIIHAADWPFVMVCAFINKFTRFPFIATVHGTDFLTVTKSRAAHLLGLADMYDKANRIVANSRFTRERFLREFPTTRVCVDVAMLGVASTWFEHKKHHDVRERYSIPACNDIVLTVARIDERKGHQLVLEALRLLPDTIKAKTSYLIIGSGDDERLLSLLRALAAGCGMQVVFAGRVPQQDLRCAYSSSTVFCMPGKEVPDAAEGFGLAYLEAATQGLPSIASKLWAIPEVVAQGKTGILVDAGNVESLANSLELLLSHPGERRRLGDGAAVWAKQFTWAACARNTYGTP